MGEVLFGRVPRALKAALAARARARGLSLNGALLELLERGLEEGEEEGSRAALQASLGASARQLEQARFELAAAELRLAEQGERAELLRGVLRALAGRAQSELGQCPRCRKPVRGFDYLVGGRCPHCAKALTAFLTPRPQVGAPERDEYLALLGALGGLVALAGAGEAPG
jgi:hypothetical protein